MSWPIAKRRTVLNLERRLKVATDTVASVRVELDESERARARQTDTLIEAIGAANGYRQSASEMQTLVIALLIRRKGRVVLSQHELDKVTAGSFGIRALSDPASGVIVEVVDLDAPAETEGGDASAGRD